LHLRSCEDCRERLDGTREFIAAIQVTPIEPEADLFRIAKLMEAAGERAVRARHKITETYLTGTVLY
jgi:hypothetical protein